MDCPSKIKVANESLAVAEVEALTSLLSKLCAAKHAVEVVFVVVIEFSDSHLSSHLLRDSKHWS